MVRSPITCVGGKYYIATRIVALMPPHEHYVEVFGGALHVFFAKYPSKLETVNDKNGEVVNFWLACRDDPEELVRKSESTPYARSLFEQWKGYPLPKEPIERAARWFYLQCSRFSGNYHGGWSYCRDKSTVGVPPAAQFRRRTTRIFAVRDRFADAQIECADFREMFERYGGCPENLLYLDPPYIGFESYYQEKFDERDHRDLAALVAGSKAKIILSYYPHPLVDELYCDLFKCEIATVKHGSARCTEKPKGTELILTNYEIQPDLFTVGSANLYEALKGKEIQR